MKGFKGMKLLTGLLSMVLIMSFGASIVLADVDVPMTVSYQCNLASSDAGELTETVNMTFYLYAADQTTVYWTETRNGIKVINGIVSVALGEIEPLTDGIIMSSAYIGVSVNGGDVMEPKSKLTSAMYAMRAAFADQFTGGAIAFDESNLSDNIVKGSSLIDNSITSDKIADGSVTSDDIADNAINSQKITTSFISVDAEDITTAAKEYILTKEDQGLVLVQGEVTIILPDPSADNKGERFTIKKTDDGLQRACDGCDIETNVVTIKCGNYTDDIRGTMFIENRTNKIHLEYKNSFVSLVSNGEFWYIVECNPLQDIFPPIPGNNGIMEEVDLKANTPVTLTWTRATDCERQNCESACKEQLYYMPYYSKGDKLTSLEIVRDSGLACKKDWIAPDPNEETITVECDTSDTDEAEEPYTDTFKVTVVVKDKYGNFSVYCPPGDNNAPNADKFFWISPEPKLVNLLWDSADDKKTIDGKETGSEKDNLTYSVYYIAGDNKACLDSLDKNEPNTGDPCFVVPAIQKQNVSGTWDPSARGTTIQYRKGDKEQCTVDIENLEPDTKYTFTIVVEDEAANKMQYDIISTTTATLE